MPGDDLTLRLTEGRFRERRARLDPEAYADPGAGIDPPTDLIKHRVWSHLVDLPTDVLLQTTDHFGSTLRAMASLSHMWICAIDPPDGDDPASLPVAFAGYLDAYDEFEAAPFIAAHGWYRQGISALRTGLEAMAHAARFSVRGDRSGHIKWRNGSSEPPKFGNSLELVAAAPTVAIVESSLPGATLFGRRPAGVVRLLYEEVCNFSHGNPGQTNAEAWEGSNGPIFAPDAFVRFWRDFRDVFLACFMLLKIAHPAVEMPGDLPEVAKNAGAVWQGVAPAAVTAYFR